MRRRPSFPALAVAVLGSLAWASAAGALWSAGASAGPQSIAAGSIAAPAALTTTIHCVPNTSLAVQLTWPASPNATSYDVSRGSASGGPYTTIGSPAVANYTDSTAAPLTNYSYVVTAKHSAWTSAFSPQATATTPRVQSCR